MNINVSVKDYHRQGVAEALRNGGYAEYAEQIEGVETMGTDEVRKAAQTLAWMASGVAGQPWVRHGINGIHTPTGTCVATTERRSELARLSDADYIAMMHPGLGLAVANLLTALDGSRHMPGVSGCRYCTMSRPNVTGSCVACDAEDVARLINGGAANE